MSRCRCRRGGGTSRVRPRPAGRAACRALPRFATVSGPLLPTPPSALPPSSARRAPGAGAGVPRWGMPSGPTRHPLPDATMAAMNSLHQLLVADVMSVEPVTVPWDAFVEDAERLMRAHGISGLPVLDGNQALVGVISQSDVLAVRGMAIGAVVRHRPSGVRVGEVMSSPAITVPITCSLVEAARRMGDARVHRLVAVDDHGRP